MATNKIKKLLIFTSLVIAIFALAHFAMAAGPDVGLSYAEGTGLSAVNDPRVIAAKIIRIALGFLGLIAIGLIIYAGWLWMTADGQEEKIEKAKKILINAVIGLVIILSAFAIASFILSKLSDATGGSGGGNVCEPACGSGQYCCNSSCSNSPCGGIPPGGGDSFNISSTIPRNLDTEVIRNVVIKVFFNKAISEQTSQAILNNNFKVEKIATVNPIDKIVTALATPEPIDGIAASSSRLISFKDKRGCGDEKNTANCLPEWSKFKVTVNGSSGLVSINNQSLNCALGANCQFEFSTGQAIDTSGPKAGILSTQICRDDGTLASIPNANLVNGWAKDDIGVSDLRFCSEKSGGAENCFPDSVKVGGLGQTYLSSSYKYDTSGYAVGDNYIFRVKANDAAGQIDKAEFSAKIRAGHCCNGVKDVNETDIDCGGQCGACDGAACANDMSAPAVCSDNLCASQFCATQNSSQSSCEAAGYAAGVVSCCLCQRPPVITGLSPVGGFCADDLNKACLADSDCGAGIKCDVNTANGAVGNFFTIYGKYFGANPGKVFVSDGADGWIQAKLANDLAAGNAICGNNVWTDSQIIAIVPANAETGAIKVENSSGLDTTSDKTGVSDFKINTIDRPGVCLLNPAHGKQDDVITYSGIKLSGANPYFGNLANKVAGVAPNFNDKNGTAKVPNITTGRTTSFVMKGKTISNFLNFTKDAEPYKGPFITSFDPHEGSAGQYVIINGNGFGDTKGASKVYFGALGGAEANFDFPQICADSIWSDKQVIVKVPTGLANGNYKITMKIGSWPAVDTTAIQPAADFKADSALPLKPSLCKISPILGKVNSQVSLYGEYFGPKNDNSKVRFQFNKDQTIFDYWRLDDDNKITGIKPDKIITEVPVSAVTGPVRAVKSDPELVGNGLNFTVGVCKTKDDCGTNNLCCSAGTAYAGQCKAGTEEQTACFPEINSCVYEWNFSTAGFSSGPLEVVDWAPEGENICRNSAITATFNQVLQTNTLAGNFLVVGNYGSVSCPANSEPLPLNAVGANYCSLKGSIKFTNGNTQVEFKPIKALDPDLDYFVIIKSGANGVLSASGKVLTGTTANQLKTKTINGVDYTGKIWQFKTMRKVTANKGLCLVNSVTIVPADYTFTSAGSDKEFAALAWSKGDSQQKSQLLTTTTDYNWDWSWEIEKPTVAQFSGGGNGLINSPTQTLVAQNVRNDLTLVHASTTIRTDNINTVQSSTVGAKKEGTATIRVCTDGSCGGDPANLKVTSWNPQGENVCRNSLIQATFNQPMNVATLVTTTKNILLVSDYGSGSCPNNSEQLPSNDTANTTSEKFCSLNGEIISKISGGKTAVDFKPKDILEADRQYYVIIKGATTTAQYTTNGVMSASGKKLISVAADNYILDIQSFNGVLYEGKIWQFKTKSKVTANKGLCLVNSVTIEPADHIFTSAGSDKEFAAKAWSKGDSQQASQQLATTTDYNWDWSWEIERKNAVRFKDGGNGLINSSTQTLIAQNVRKDMSFVHASSTIKIDNISEPLSLTVGAKKQGTATVKVDLCSNGNCPPEISSIDSPTVRDWNPKGENICRNSLIQATFNQAMQINTFKTNIIVVGDYELSQCPAGYQYLTKVYQPSIFARIKFWLAKIPLVNKLFASPVRALTGNFCAVTGTVSGSLSSDGKETRLEFKPQKLLEASRQYYVIIKSGNNGVLSASGKTLTGTAAEPLNTETFNGVSYEGKIWSFTTMAKQAANNGACEIDHTEITPVNKLFQTNKNDISDDALGDTFNTVNDSDLVYTAEARSKDGSILSSLDNVYSWSWNWTSGSTDIFDIFELPASGLENNGNKRVVRAKSTATAGQSVITATANVVGGKSYPVQTAAYLMVCANPWPPIKANGTWTPFQENGLKCVGGGGNCQGVQEGQACKDSAGTCEKNCTAQATNCDNTNFELSYCRDAGGEGTADDLPAILSDNTVIRGRSANLKCDDGTGSCVGLDKGQVCSDNTGKCDIDILKEFYFFREGEQSTAEVFSVSALKKGDGVKVTWNPVDKAVGYKVYYGTVSGSYGQSIATTTLPDDDNPQIITGLTNGQKYYFALTSYNNKNVESDYLKLANSVIPGDTEAPTTPLINGLIAKGNKVEAVWQDQSQGDAKRFKLFYGADDNNFGAAVNISYNANGTTTVSNLADGVTYYFGLVAYDFYNNPSATSTTKSIVAGINLTAVANNITKQGKTAALYWNNFAPVAENYLIYYGTVSGSYGTPIATTTLPTAANPQIISGLTNGIKYYFAVKAQNGGVESAYSNVISVTPVDVWSPVTPVLFGKAVKASTASLSWPANQDDTVKYKIYYGGNSGGYTNSVATSTAGTVSNPQIISGLNTEATYYFAITALDAYGNESNKSQEINLIIK